MLAVLLLTQQVMAVAPQSQFDADQDSAYRMLIHACQVTGYNCDGEIIPQVRTNPQMKSMKIRGLYQGGYILWIENDLMPIQRRLTIFHETVHYLQFEVGKANMDMASRCLLEREAMEYTNLYVDLMGYGDEFKRDLLEWQISYRC